MSQQWGEPGRDQDAGRYQYGSDDPYRAAAGEQPSRGAPYPQGGQYGGYDGQYGGQSAQYAEQGGRYSAQNGPYAPQGNQYPQPDYPYAQGGGRYPQADDGASQGWAQSPGGDPRASAAGGYPPGPGAGQGAGTGYAGAEGGAYGWGGDPYGQSGAYPAPAPGPGTGARGRRGVTRPSQGDDRSAQPGDQIAQSPDRYGQPDTRSAHGRDPYSSAAETYARPGAEAYSSSGTEAYSSSGADAYSGPEDGYATSRRRADGADPYARETESARVRSRGPAPAAEAVRGGERGRERGGERGRVRGVEHESGRGPEVDDELARDLERFAPRDADEDGDPWKRDGNAFAVLGAAFAILFFPLGLVFSIVGLVVAKGRAGARRTVAIIGLSISLLFTLGVAGLYAVAQNSASSDPGCIAADGALSSAATTFGTDDLALRNAEDLGNSSDVQAEVATYIHDVKSFQAQLNSAEQQAQRANVKSALAQWSTDIGTLATGLQSLQGGSLTQEDQVQAALAKNQSDGDAVGKLCSGPLAGLF